MAAASPHGDGAWFLTSTKVLTGNPSTLKVDPKTGKTLKKWETPGWGIYGAYTTPHAQAGDLPLASGGHGVKWAGRDKYWMAVPASGKLYLMNAEEGTVVRSIQAPTVRTHASRWMAITSGVWAATKRKSTSCRCRMAPSVAKIVLDKVGDPSLHGLDIKDGVAVVLRRQPRVGFAT